MSLIEFATQLKEYVTESIRHPTAAAHKIALRADFMFGVKVFVLMGVVIFVVNFVLGILNMVLDIMVGIGFGWGWFLHSITTAIKLPVMSLVILPFLLFLVLVLSVIWFAGKLLGGKAGFGKFFGCLAVVQTGLLLLQALFNQLINLTLNLILVVVGIVTALGVVSKIKFLGVITTVTALLTGTGALGLFSFIGIAFFVAGIYYSTVFVREVHEISTGRALIAVLVPTVIAAVTVLVFLASILALIGIPLYMVPS